MVLVTAGAFQMGCNEALDAACQDDEKPYHQVTLQAFKIDKTEVTQTAYQACVTAGACTAPATAAGCNWDPATRGQHPVTCVSWDQAGAYCAWKLRRLPSEAEWEKAARGASGNVYPWGSADPTCTLSNYGDCVGGTAPVGSCPTGAGPNGVLDMGGNVYEWVKDWYDPAYYAASPLEDPLGPAAGTNRGMRGGGFGYEPLYLRTSNRGGNPPTAQYAPLGFRCAKSAL
jgi:formylglycine-generating enzyme required for sulfatase activity